MSLLEDHRDLARKIASRFYHQGVDRDDLQQEALIALHKATETWNRRCKFSTFAHDVIKNRMIELTRAAKRRPVIVAEIEDQHLESRSLEEIVELREEFRELVGRWRQLNERQSQIMRRAVRGDSYEDVATELGTTVAAVKWNVWDARRTLGRAA